MYLNSTLNISSLWINCINRIRMVLLGWVIQYYNIIYSTASACKTLPCYLIDEVAACRTGAGIPTGGATTDCDSLETFSL